MIATMTMSTASTRRTIADLEAALETARAEREAAYAVLEALADDRHRRPQAERRYRLACGLCRAITERVEAAYAGLAYGQQAAPQGWDSID